MSLATRNKKSPPPPKKKNPKIKKNKESTKKIFARTCGAHF